MNDDAEYTGEWLELTGCTCEHDEDEHGYNRDQGCGVDGCDCKGHFD